MNTMNTIHECLQKPDQYPLLHALLHAAAVGAPVALASYSPAAAAISVACWGFVFLVFGGHGAKAVGGDLGAVTVSLTLGVMTLPVAEFLGIWGVWVWAYAFSLTLAWLTEFHQNGGHWCGQDKANLRNRAIGAGIGATVSAGVLIA